MEFIYVLMVFSVYIHMYGIQIIYNSDMPVFFKILLPF